MKTFLISIDTEGDNLWNWVPGQPITTRNASYVMRFQQLCEKYGFKPTYLTNFEMACDDEFVHSIVPHLRSGNCEIGMHLHAWNTPPEYELTKRSVIKPGECSYLVEYPSDIMESKIKTMTDLLKEKFEVRPVTHRAGRWATNKEYFRILNRYDYSCDCSVAPGMNMVSAKGFTQNSAGSDYTSFPLTPYRIDNTELVEIPMTVRENHCIKREMNASFKRKLYRRYQAIKGRGKIWLRPNGHNLDEMIWLTDRVYSEKTDYIMFMLHTSEMMPGGSPTFPTEESIEKMYSDIEELFVYASKKYCGQTIGDHAAALRQSGVLPSR